MAIVQVNGDGGSPEMVRNDWIQSACILWVKMRAFPEDWMWRLRERDEGKD